MTANNKLNPIFQGKGLYHPSFEHDACGVGLLCNIQAIASHKIIADAIHMLENLNHRGALGVELNSGDGAGILFSMPHEFFTKVTKKLAIALPEPGKYAVAQVFFPKNKKLRETLRATIEKTIKSYGGKPLGWRLVPCKSSLLGYTSKSTEPVIEQLFVEKKKGLAPGAASELFFYIIRKHIQRIARGKHDISTSQFYICSFSVYKIIYKGQLTPHQLFSYFKDLKDPSLKSHFAIIHSRFSTNTLPSWDLAHPYRFLAHNGEINTIRGNINWFQARKSILENSSLSKKQIQTISPILYEDLSDSSILDQMVEFLALSGRSLPHVLMMLSPEAWENQEDMPPQLKAFFEYHAALTEPWDGPAALCLSDGHRYLCASLDRNGLRPARYTLYKDGMLVMGSESGLNHRQPANLIQRKGRLGPGEILAVDFTQKKILFNDEIKNLVASEKPYQKYIQKKRYLQSLLPSLPSPKQVKKWPDYETIRRQQKAFGYTEEELRIILAPMIMQGEEPTGSMGSDTPLAVLSRKPQNFFNYFHQLFAQVTNPPIDPIREKAYMSLKVFLGAQQNLIQAGDSHAQVLELAHPVLRPKEFDVLKNNKVSFLKAKVLDAVFSLAPPAGKASPKALPSGKILEKAIEDLCHAAQQAVEKNYTLLIISDRSLDKNTLSIPSLLAISAVHQHLMRIGKRSLTSLILETGDARHVHHFALLLGYGANAIFPYQAYFSIKIFLEQPYSLSSERPTLQRNMPTLEQAEQNYLKALEKGLLKVISKMGISTIRSYTAAQIFECVGLNQSVVKKYFSKTISRIAGIGLAEIEEERRMLHREAYGDISNIAGSRKTNSPKNSWHALAYDDLDPGGYYQWRQRGERHMYSPMVIHKLQRAVQTNRYQDYQQYAALVDSSESNPFTLRSMLDFKDLKPIALSQVEPTEALMKRFVTGAMSFGSISRRAHTTLAIAMNRMGARSNTGEGGEDPSRYKPLPSGDSMNSAIKQIASGRFGVTLEYLLSAKELQIKIAQGAKPGEGGQLPGFKVDENIAAVRHCTPYVGLISPPPHHDIYSIEDLAQLIYDLKCSNTKAKVSVKLVASAGVGTIAVGVVKGYADRVTISGYDGGTGASPLTSIKHAGLPWELGLSETHQTLVANRLRNRVLLQTDGQIKTGRDLAIATLLGAEEWGVASAALVAMGCIMMRKCHLNTCPVGVATQRPQLEALFSGEADHVVNLFKFLAQHLREIMAKLGFRKVNDMVGRTDKLFQLPSTHWKAKKLNLAALLQRSYACNADGSQHQHYCTMRHRDIVAEANHAAFFKNLEQALSSNSLQKTNTSSTKPSAASIATDVQGMAMQQSRNNKSNKPAPIHYVKQTNNTQRTFGTVLASKIASGALPLLRNKKIHIKLHGSAGQSFAAFSTKNIFYTLYGDANDYFAKGLNGSTIALLPEKTATYLAAENVIVGNVSFYGAISGKGYLGGLAGERFCVRNSGAEVVVEGVGAHGCEYMTGGRVIVLGAIGKNFAAGMSGGIAYLYHGKFGPSPASLTRHVNLELVRLERPDEADWPYLRKQLTAHASHTKSLAAKKILKHWNIEKQAFIKVMPIDYKRSLKLLAKKKAKTSLRSSILAKKTAKTAKTAIAAITAI